LAHCSFAMLGGYVTVTLMNRLGWPFLATLPAAFIAAAAASVLLERAFFRRFYHASDLEQFVDHIAPADPRSGARKFPELKNVDHLTIREWLLAEFQEGVLSREPLPAVRTKPERRIHSAR